MQSSGWRSLSIARAKGLPLRVDRKGYETVEDDEAYDDSWIDDVFSAASSAIVNITTTECLCAPAPLCDRWRSMGRTPSNLCLLLFHTISLRKHAILDRARACELGSKQGKWRYLFTVALSCLTETRTPGCSLTSRGFISHNPCHAAS
jgi:hypothetical protein